MFEREKKWQQNRVSDIRIYNFWTNLGITGGIYFINIIFDVMWGINKWLIQKSPCNETLESYISTTIGSR